MTVVEKKKRGRPRTRPVKFTEDERRLLAYPPTLETWICVNRYGEGNILCEVPNAGYQDKCWVCGTPKSEKSLLAWDLYVKVCEKVGVDPSLRKSVDINNYNIKGGEEVPLFRRRKKETTVVFDEPLQTPVETPAAVKAIVSKSEDAPVKPKASRKPRTTNQATAKATSTTAKTTSGTVANKPVVKKTVTRKSS